MLTALALAALTVAFLIAFSRSGVPRQQRTPWHEIHLRDLVHHTIDGASRLAELHGRRRFES